MHGNEALRAALRRAHQAGSGPELGDPMAYFPDLSEYEYLPPIDPAVRQINVGWLAAGREFERKKASGALLDSVWDYCTLSFEQSRGRHECEFCLADASRISERNSQQLLLGSAEIRVLSRSGEIYAAPNLIYHYMVVHDYAPPDQFIDAVMTGPRPFSQDYRDRLAAAGLVPTPTFKPRVSSTPPK
jgi:hypothetical protein